MATDFRVTFKGDLGNLAQFDAAIRNSVTQNNAAIENANKSLLSKVGNVQGLFDPRSSGAGLFYNKLRTDIDSVNKTFVHTGQLVRRVTSDFEILERKTKDSAGNIVKAYSLKPQFQDLYDAPYKQRIGDEEKYLEAIKRTGVTEQKILKDREASLKRTIPHLEKIDQLNAKRATTETRREQTVVGNQVVEGSIRARRGQAQVDLAKVDPANTAEVRRLTREITSLDRELAKAQKDGANLLKPFDKALKALDHQLDVTQRRIDRLLASQAGRAARSRGANSAYADADAAVLATPPINRDLATVLQQSKDLRKNLLKSGLGAGARTEEDFKRVLHEQEAAVTRYTNNLRTGVRTVQGSFKDLNTGLLQQFTVDLDKNGQVIGRWGGQLAGAGNFLRQTVRDFQKVIEWTVATTLVFGTLATVVTRLRTVNELNTSLTRLSITAQTTAEETGNLFDALARVSIQTATPLNELVSAADDIALATRQAGDSTVEWTAKIVDLTTAVGIFTNLTGTETVEATDQLSSAFKQLGIAPAELIGILNKVTAVAGGQSTAINDIVKGLAGLAEAAKAAGLSVDEQIASIQVLSQVTNKSSDEVATAFKNLFGAVSSVGSEKILKEFGIDIRDASGGLRDFLDIYRDIKEALDTGVIPQNRLPDVLRGISGGPRRAPDAAALLGNLDKVFEVVEKSAGATNEALVANAKILDTNAAKIQQFQNAFDIAVFQKFGAVIKDITEALTGFGTDLLGAFNQLDPNIISITVKLGAMLLVFKALAATVKLIGLKDLAVGLVTAAKGFLGMGAAAATANQQLTLFNASAAATGGAPGQLARFGGSKTKLAALGIAGAGLVGGVAAAKSGVDTNTIGTLLQVGGSLALLVPSLQAVGIGLIAGGTALQLFAGDSTTAAKSTKEVAKEVLTLTDTLRASQDEANKFVTAQKKASDQMIALQTSTTKTADEQKLLSAATESYVVATVGLVGANENVNRTFQELLSTLPGLSKEYEKFLGIATQGIDSPQIAELRENLVKDLLKGTGQSIYSGTPLQAATSFRSNQGTDTTATPLGRQGARIRGLQGPIEDFDLSDLLRDAGKLKELFDKFGNLKFDIPQNDLALGYLQTALTEVSTDLKKYGVSEEQFDVLSKAITELAGATSTLAQNRAIIAQTDAAVQANTLLGIFKGQQTDNANLAIKILDKIATTQANAPRTTGSPDERGQATPAVNRLQENFANVQTAALAGLPVANQTLIDIAKNTFEAAAATDGLGSLYDQLKAKGDEALNKGLYNWLVSAGVGTEQLTELAQILEQTLENVAAAAERNNAVFDEARKSAAGAFASRALQLQISENSGDFKKNADGLRKLKEQNREALDANNSLIDSMEQLSDVALADVNQALSEVIGLQGQYLTAAELNSDQEGFFAERVTETTNKLLENAVAAGVNAEGIRKIEERVAQLIGLITAIPTYKKVVVEIETRLTGAPGGGGYYPSGGFNALQDQLDTAQKEDQKTAKNSNDTIKQLLRQINKIIAGGTGSSFGSKASKTKAAAGPGRDVSEIDLPDEIANAANRSTLIQEAIRRARALQKTIPGANKEAQNDIVSLLKGTQNILKVRGVKDDLLRRALEELADIEKKRLEFETKADTIRRIRVSSGDFSGIANVPVNTRTGVSLGSPSGPINVTLNLNGTLLTPAQFGQFADLIAASLKRQIANG